MGKPWTPARIEARERRRAAIHEAGHVVMAREVGMVSCQARIWRNWEADELSKTWIGHSQFVPMTVTLKRGARLKSLSKKDLALFAVAGAVAEFCWQDYSFEESQDCESWFEPEVMSSTDWAGCNCQPAEPTRALLKTIEKAFALLNRKTGKLWPDLLDESRDLIIESRENSCDERSVA